MRHVEKCSSRFDPFKKNIDSDPGSRNVYPRINVNILLEHPGVLLRMCSCMKERMDYRFKAEDGKNCRDEDPDPVGSVDFWPAGSGTFFNRSGYFSI